MGTVHSWPWIESQAAKTAEAWRDCSPEAFPPGPSFTTREQGQREAAFDDALHAVEHETKRRFRSRDHRLEAQDRITATFGRFAADALDLEPEAVSLLTGSFLPTAQRFIQWAHGFDENLSRAEITQACRNALTACGLQPLLGSPIALTPSIIGYSLLYPYSDNYLDGNEVSSKQKLTFSRRFRARLCGDAIQPRGPRESTLWTLVGMIEEQFPRANFPQVYECLLAIHRAQEESLAQIGARALSGDAEILRITCAKGGSSVLADACLVRGGLSEEESQFAFDWGVLLQLGDDLQDLGDDLERGSMTLFTRAAAAKTPLDGLARQLLHFSESVGARMDSMPSGSLAHKRLLKLSWRQLILMAIAGSHSFFSAEFLRAAERRSPFRFAFLRARRNRLTDRRGLPARLFDLFLIPRKEDRTALPMVPLREFREFRRLESAAAD